jgi:hypothetical protein
MGRGGNHAAPRLKRKTDTVEKITASNFAAASFNADEAALILPLAAQAAIKGKAAIDVAKGKQAAALAVMVAGFASDEAALRPWTFDIKGTDETDIHTHVECMGVAEYGDDSLAWKRNAQGAVSKTAQTAYKAGFQAAFFNLPAPVAAVWTMASKAIPMARAIRAEGMTADIVNGELKLSGGNGDKAAAMREAKSLSALAKAAKGEAGSNRAAPQNEKGGDNVAPVATPSEILAAALRLIEGAAKGEEALAPNALSFARRIATLVASNPDAFADD